MKRGEQIVNLLLFKVFVESQKQNRRVASRQTPYFCPDGDKSKQKRLAPSNLSGLKPFGQKLAKSEPGGPFAKKENSPQRIFGRRIS
jgi:hypothetical protein